MPSESEGGGLKMNRGGSWGLKEEEEEQKRRRRRVKGRSRKRGEGGGWTDGRGYAWLKGARREEAVLGVQGVCVCVCVFNGEETPRFAPTSPNAQLILKKSLHLSSSSFRPLFALTSQDSLLIDVKSALNPSK